MTDEYMDRLLRKFSEQMQVWTGDGWVSADTICVWNGNEWVDVKPNNKKSKRFV